MVATAQKAPSKTDVTVSLTQLHSMDSLDTLTTSSTATVPAQMATVPSRPPPRVNAHAARTPVAVTKAPSSVGCRPSRRRVTTTDTTNAPTTKNQVAAMEPIAITRPAARYSPCLANQVTALAFTEGRPLRWTPGRCDHQAHGRDEGQRRAGHVRSPQGHRYVGPALVGVVVDAPTTLGYLPKATFAAEVKVATSGTYRRLFDFQPSGDPGTDGVLIDLSGGQRLRGEVDRMAVFAVALSATDVGRWQVGSGSRCWLPTDLRPRHHRTN